MQEYATKNTQEETKTDCVHAPAASPEASCNVVMKERARRVAGAKKSQFNSSSTPGRSPGEGAKQASAKVRAAAGRQAAFCRQYLQAAEPKPSFQASDGGSLPVLTDVA
jgi:hypothetical protein